MQAQPSPYDHLQSQVLQKTVQEVAEAAESADVHTGQAKPCCVICLDAISEPCEARPCGHGNFDYLCLLSWLERLSKCPLCKASIHQVVHSLDHDGPGSSSVYLVPQFSPGAHPSLSQPSLELSPRPAAQSRNARRRQFASRHHCPSPTKVDTAILRRQHVYRERLYSFHVGSNPYSGYRELSPSLFRSDPELPSRARTWLRRELQVFHFLDRELCEGVGLELRPSRTMLASEHIITRRRANNAEYLLEYIIAILKTVDIQGSEGAARDMLKDFLGSENATQLLHELRSFLRSPWSLEEWDRKVQYSPTPTHRPKGRGADIGRSDESPRQTLLVIRD
ncbi:hypothetical protein F5Y18DRAFT_186912 [Xylariaceae sp. FL1019]|nr:hypothetical protein F5Y18DRAFT_186912 [Xylariaceae sp. FL1019]